MRRKKFHTILGILIFSSFAFISSIMYFLYEQKNLDKSASFVMFFNGSLDGLSTSSSVNYRGVKIGKVRRVEITEFSDSGDIVIPVYVEFYVERSLYHQSGAIEKLINQNWRASILKPNLLTGVADIELVQDSSIRAPILKKYKGYRQFPTVAKSVKEMTLDEALDSAKKMLDNFSAFIKSPEIQKTVSAAEGMATSFDNLANAINQQLPTVVGYFNQSLKEISRAAYSTQALTEYLSRHPESILRGKP